LLRSQSPPHSYILIQIPITPKSTLFPYTTLFRSHFKESKVQRKTRESNNQYRRETSSRIQQLKEQFNDRFDGEVNQMREDFEQALIDAHAEIQAAEQRMEALITTTRNDWTDTFEAEVAEI